MDNQDLNKLSKEELINIINKLNMPIIPFHNRIESAGFVVESNSETLQGCKKVIDKLIDKHKKFNDEILKNNHITNMVL